MGEIIFTVLTAIYIYISANPHYDCIQNHCILLLSWNIDGIYWILVPIQVTAQVFGL